MRLIRIQFLILIILGFVTSFLFIASPVNRVQAQVKYVATLCLYTDNFDVEWPNESGKCATNTGLISVKPVNVPTTFKAVCVVKSPSGNAYKILDSIDQAGKATCDKYKNDTANYTNVTLVAKTSFLGTEPPVGTNTTTGSTNNNQSTTNTTTTNTTNTNSTTNNTNSTTTRNPTRTNTKTNNSSSTVNDIGNCPEGFTSKGPLCVPNNPFGDSDGIAGKGSVGELATSIISILLSISGIVAVIMIIIGGYTYMTARGNETQQTNGRKTLVNALIGLAIVIVSYALVQAITNYLTDR